MTRARESSAVPTKKLLTFSATKNIDVLIAQFFKQKSSRASQQVCRPGAEQADKFVF
jgi:hypothetical protein